mgnify:CR=1 FL=1
MMAFKNKPTSLKGSPFVQEAPGPKQEMVPGIMEVLTEVSLKMVIL